MREHQSNRQPEDMATVCHALAMLYFVLRDISKVGNSYIMQPCEISEQSRTHVLKLNL